MPTNPKPRRPRKLSGPPADSTCTRSRTVTHGALVLTVWSCSEPRTGHPGAARSLRLASVVKRIGGRSWRFFFVSRAEASGGDVRCARPGYWFEALDRGADWPLRSPVGPYETFVRALEDARFGVAVGVW